MKTLFLILLIIVAGCKKEKSEEIQPTPTPVVIPPAPPLPDIIFSIRVFDIINETEWSNALGWDYFEYYNLTTNGTPASPIDQYWLTENDTIGISAKFDPAYPYSTIYVYIKSWTSLADTIPIEFKDTVIVNLLEFNYTYIYQ